MFCGCEYVVFNRAVFLRFMYRELCFLCRGLEETAEGRR